MIEFNCRFGDPECETLMPLLGPELARVLLACARGELQQAPPLTILPGCSACVPIRIPVAGFQPDRTLRRIAKANAGVEGFVMPARASAEQFQLFQRYQQARHGDGDMATMSFYDYRAMVEDTPITTGLVEFRDASDRLLGACLTDWLSDGLSAVYSFFAPEEDRRSLGAFAVDREEFLAAVKILRDEPPSGDAFVTPASDVT